MKFQLNKYKKCLNKDCSSYRYKKCYDLPNDPKLKNIEICPITSFIDNEIENTIVLKKCDTDKKGYISCVHTRVTDLSPEEFEKISSYEEVEKLIREKMPELREKEGLILEPKEHFIALSSYVEGIREVGLTKSLRDSLISSDVGWFDPMLINQFLNAILDINAKEVFNELGKDFIDYLYDSYSKTEGGFELSAKRLDLYKKMDITSVCCVDPYIFDKCSELFPYNPNKEDIYDICAFKGNTHIDVANEIVRYGISKKDDKLLSEILDNNGKKLKPNIIENIADYIVNYKIMYDDDNYIRKIKYRLARNQKASPKVLEKLYKDKKIDANMFIASNPNTPPYILEELANSEDLSVIKDVINNPNTPTSTLEKLINKDNNIKEAIAENPSTPPKILEKLADDDSDEVREAVAKNTNTPIDILIKLADDENIWVRRNIVLNPNTQPEVLEKLAYDEDESIKLAIARNSKTPSYILEKLANDDNDLVRFYLIYNPNTTDSAILKLMNDEKTDIRLGAEKEAYKRGLIN